MDNNSNPLNYLLENSRSVAEVVAANKEDNPDYQGDFFIEALLKNMLMNAVDSVDIIAGCREVTEYDEPIDEIRSWVLDQSWDHSGTIDEFRNPDIHSAIVDLYYNSITDWVMLVNQDGGFMWILLSPDAAINFSQIHYGS